MKKHRHRLTLMDLAEERGLFQKLVDSHQTLIETYEALFMSVNIEDWRADARAYIDLLKKNQQGALQNRRYADEALLGTQRLLDGSQHEQ